MFVARGFPRPSRCVLAMAPHLTPMELDIVMICLGNKMEAQAICDIIAEGRARAGIAAPKIWAVRRAMAGATHRRSKPEARGRKRKLSEAQSERLFGKRRELITKKGGKQYVRMDDMVACARVPKVHRTTAARYLRKAPLPSTI